MKTMFSLVLVFLFAGIASAQPPRMEWGGKVKELGDPERLEKSQGDIKERKPWEGPRHFPPRQSNWGPGKNKYGGPMQDSMRNWGGTPFRDFGPGRPWGYMGGQGGPPRDFRGNPFHNGGRGWQHHGGREDFKRSSEKSKCDGNCSCCKKCPFCGSKIS